MVDPRYNPSTIEEALQLVEEEAAEVILAVSKAKRFGLDNFDPRLPEADRESNLAAVLRECADIELRIEQLKLLAEAKAYAPDPAVKVTSQEILCERGPVYAHGRARGSWPVTNLDLAWALDTCPYQGSGLRVFASPIEGRGVHVVLRNNLRFESVAIPYEHIKKRRRDQVLNYWSMRGPLDPVLDKEYELAIEQKRVFPEAWYTD